MNISNILPLRKPKSVKDINLHMVADTTFCAPSGLMRGGVDFFPQYFQQALAHLRPCLKEVDIVEKDGYKEIGNYAAMLIGLLTGFKKLRKVSMMAFVLFSPPNHNGEKNKNKNKKKEEHIADLLPESLESLNLEDCRVSILEQVHELLEKKEKGFPKLKEVVLVLSVYLTPSRKEFQAYTDRIEILKGHCKVAGFDLIANLLVDLDVIVVGAASQQDASAN